MKFYITTLLLLSAFLLLETNQVFADDIVIYEPAANGLLYGDSPMDIRYRIRKNGMASLGSTNVSLSNAETKEFVTDFPNATWTNTYEADLAVHDLWYIPPTLANGTYTLRVFGTATYPCSKANNGKAPYGRCQTQVEKAVTFFVLKPI
ncbi:hypothetical protein BDC45DRAFT_542132 [Circinella umbellata]|nr:hypothetical protein BDC45DRAFT_542132 [Circinella umbellata]